MTGDTIDFNEHQQGVKQVNVDVPLALWINAKKNLIGWTDTLIFGIKFKLADADGGMTYNYPETNMYGNLSRKIKILEKALQEAVTELDKIKNPEKLQAIEEEADAELKALGVTD